MGHNEKPILMSAPMVKVTLADIKTHTRRPVKPQPDDHHWQRFESYQRKIKLIECSDGIHLKNCHSIDDNYQSDWVAKCPYGKPGEYLWVRESWAAPVRFDHIPPRDIPVGYQIDYLADDKKADPDRGRTRPSIHMPRIFSRILLKIVSVKIERIQDISPEDCLKEGVFHETFTHEGKEEIIVRFQELWESINGNPKPVKPDYSWGSNCYVWIIEFERVTP
jgi:hypothetical protein